MADIVSAAHTPGPWRVHSGQVPSATSIVADIDNGITIIIDGYKLGEPESDARLIAAAPDLLAALESITDRFISLVNIEYGDGSGERQTEVIAARAATTKARGQS